MVTFTLEIEEFLETFNLDTRQIIAVRIKSNRKSFSNSSRDPYVLVTDGTTSVKSFRGIISKDQKSLIALLTSDAFDNFTGNVTIEFGPGNYLNNTFSDINLSTVLIPLDPIFASISASPGDSAWLASIT